MDSRKSASFGNVTIVMYKRATLIFYTTIRRRKLQRGLEIMQEKVATQAAANNSSLKLSFRWALGLPTSYYAHP